MEHREQDIIELLEIAKKCDEVWEYRSLLDSSGVYQRQLISESQGRIIVFPHDKEDMYEAIASHFGLVQPKNVRTTYESYRGKTIFEDLDHKTYIAVYSPSGTVFMDNFYCLYEIEDMPKLLRCTKNTIKSPIF